MSNLVGQTLKKRYFLRASVGSGGMAEVYTAWDNKRSATMAVKVLRRDLALNPRFFQMFAKEAEYLRQLNHPSIVRIYEFDREGDIVFIVMDWVEGKNLRQALENRKGPLPLAEVSRILMPVSSALYYAHQNRVYHCDIKPANILLHKDGNKVLLTDFGVARLANDEISGGTPAYMAPEQFVNAPIDSRTDVYGLGITIYEMLSGGQLPYRGDSPGSRGSTLRERIGWEHQHLQPPPLSKYNAKLPEAIYTVVTTALNKQPEQRYSSPRDLREAFEHAREAKGKPGSQPRTQLTPLPARPATPPPKTPSAARVKGPYLMGLSGEWAGQAIPLPKGGITLGRSSSNQVQLQEKSVSRQHAAIQFRGRNVILQDTNSSLGTMVNGKRISNPVLLRAGDVIQIGYHEMFEFRDR